MTLANYSQTWVKKEEKGFVKGRYILDAVIAPWEGVEHVEETKQDICFLKIHFDKAYDRVEWVSS